MILTAILLCIYFNKFWIYTGFRCSKCRYRKYTLSIYFVKCQLRIPGRERVQVQGIRLVYLKGCSRLEKNIL